MKSRRARSIKDSFLLKACRSIQEEDLFFRTAMLVRAKNEAMELDEDQKEQKMLSIYK